MEKIILPSYTVSLPTGELTLDVIDSDFCLTDLTDYAARQNPKRGFLFVSKLLAKYWPSDPVAMRHMHHYLANNVARFIQGSSVFIGMAEAAAGLGQGVYEAYLDNNTRTDHLFIHTSRYLLTGVQRLDFQEQHSHASQFYLHIPLDPILEKIFLTAETLVLIDDELTTGTTFANLIQAYKGVNSAIKRVVIVSILNFVRHTRQQEIRQQVELDIVFIDALSAKINFKSTPNYHYQDVPNVRGKAECKRQQLSLVAGRLGIQGHLLFDPTPLKKLIQLWQKGKTVLVLGTGEFVHLAFLMGGYIEQQGWLVKIQSTARSPLLKGDAIQEKMEFTDNYADDIPNYLYNVTEDQYEYVVICHETPMNAPLKQLVKRLNAYSFYYANGKISLS